MTITITIDALPKEENIAQQFYASVHAGARFGVGEATTWHGAAADAMRNLHHVLTPNENRQPTED